MKIERTITSNISEAIALERAIAYLRHMGYKQITGEPFLTFHRGSVLGSWISFTPKGWKAKATVQVMSDDNQVKVAAVFEINTTGQLVTDKERAFWDAEVNGLEVALCSGEVNPVTGIEFARSALYQNIAAATVIICLSLVLAIAARWMLDSRLAGYLGGIIGMVLGFAIARRWLRFKFK